LESNYLTIYKTSVPKLQKIKLQLCTFEWLLAKIGLPNFISRAVIPKRLTIGMPMGALKAAMISVKLI